MEYFKFAFEDVVEWHINHAFYGEMSTKSTVVSSNILMYHHYHCLEFYIFLSHVSLLVVAIVFVIIIM